MNLENYIKEHWNDTVRLERNDKDGFIGLPYEYYVPSVKGAFQEMYYWDSFFTAKGLFLHGREALVKSQVENMFFLIGRFGYMPNGSNLWLVSRSQPPYLSLMVKDVYEVYKDKIWLGFAYSVLEKEYKFWSTKRSTPCGLNRYGYEGTEKDFPADAKLVRTRLPGYDFGDRTDKDIATNVMCDAESGWDFNPRCEMYQLDCAYVDLNSLLYMFEKNMSYFAQELENGMTAKWNTLAEKRKELMQKLMWNGEVFLDYNFKTGEHSKYFTAASFFPLWAGIATEEQAKSMLANLHRIEFDYGIAVGEPGERTASYQWDYPNGWAPLHYTTVYALDNYGFKEDACRVAEKYVKSIEKIFEETGTLWEKYNVVEGSMNVTDEYEMPEMLGWTAGVYTDLKHYLEKNK